MLAGDLSQQIDDTTLLRLGGGQVFLRPNLDVALAIITLRGLRWKQKDAGKQKHIGLSPSRSGLCMYGTRNPSRKPGSTRTEALTIPDGNPNICVTEDEDGLTSHLWCMVLCSTMYIS